MQVRRALRSPIVILALVSLPFLLVFYDQFNLNAAIYSSTFLAIGLNPYEHGSSVVAGFPLLPYNLVAYYLYGLLGFNPLAVAVALKVVALTFTYLSGYVLWRIAQREGWKHPNVIFYSFILNPFLLFVDLIWVQTDSIVIFALLLGYALILYGWERKNSISALGLGTVCILWAVFSYYFPVVLLPTLVLYRRGIAQRLDTLAMILGISALFVIPMLWFGLHTSFFSTISSGIPTVSPYSTFNLVGSESSSFISTAGFVALIIIVVGAVAIPIALRKVGVPEQLSMFVVLAFAFLTQVNFLQGDNLAFLIGLLLLSVIFVPGVRWTYARILALQVFVVPFMLIILLFNGPGYTSGFFYWSYDQFHINFLLYSRLGDWGIFLSKVSLLFYLLSLLSLMALLLLTSIRMAPGPSGSASSPPPHSHHESLAYDRRRSLFLVSCSLVVVAALLVLPVLLSPGAPSGKLEPSKLAPDYFMSYDYGSPTNPTYAMSAPTTFTVDASNSSVYFAPTSPPVGLFRNVSDQAFSVDLSARALFAEGPNASANVALVGATSFAAGEADATVVNATMVLNPESGSEFVDNRSGVTPVFYGSTRIYWLNGTGVLVYDLKSTNVTGHTIVFGGELDVYGQSQNILWTMSVGGVGYEAFLHGGSFYLGYTENGSWIFATTPADVAIGQWFAYGFYLTEGGTSLDAFLNGASVSVPFSGPPIWTTTLYEGKFDASAQSNYQFASQGNFSNAFSLPLGYNLRQQIVYLGASTSDLVYFPLSGPALLNLSLSPGGATVTIGDRSESFAPTYLVWIGKLSSGDVPLYLTLTHLSIQSTYVEVSFLGLAVVFSILVPSAALWWFTLARRRPFRERPTNV